MPMKKILLATALIIFTTILCGGAEAADADKELRLGIFIASGAGVSSSQGFGQINSFLENLSEAYDFKFSIHKYSSTHEVADAFIKDEVDVAYLYPDTIVDILDHGKKVFYIGSYSVNKEKKRKVCLWQNKKTAVSDVSRAKKKRLLLYELSPLLLAAVKEILVKKGETGYLWQYFDSITLVAGQNSGYMALAMEDGDFLLDNSDGGHMMDVMQPGFSGKLSDAICTEKLFGRGTSIMNKSTVDEETTKKFQKAFIHFSSGKNSSSQEFAKSQSLLSFMKLAKIKFMPLEENPFAHEVALHKKAKDKGWYREIDFLIKKMEEAPKGKPVIIKPDIDACAALCDNDFTCIDACMM